jgi:hypothetical protein
MAKKPRRAVPRGRVPGVPVPSTEKSRAASRVNGWKTGRYARVVTARDARRAQLEKAVPGAAVLMEAYAEGIGEGNLDALEPLSITAMAENEILRRRAVDEVRERGVLVEEALIDKDGREIGSRVKANPALEHVHAFNETLGYSADQLQLSRKSRGEGAVNLAMAFRLSRDQQLRAMDQKTVALPPPAIDSEVVE